MNSLPPIWSSAIFNTNAFQGTKYLTRQEADQLYLSISAGADLILITGVVAGIGQAGKALSLDASGNLTVMPGSFTFTGSNSQLLISNNSTASTSSSTGAICIAGGIYVGNNSYFNGINTYAGVSTGINMIGTVSSTINMNSAIFSSFTMSSSTGFILLQGTNQYLSLQGANNYITIANTTASTSSTTGSIRCAGGAYFGNDSIFLKKLSIGSSTEVASTVRITSNLNPASGSGLELAFNGTTTSNIYSYNRSTSTYLSLNLNDKILIDGSGNTMINSSIAAGKLNIGGIASIYGLVIMNSVSSQNKAVMIGTNSSADMILTCQDLITPANAEFIFQTNGFMGIGGRATSLANPRYPLDNGAAAADVILNLYQSGSTALYGIGANNTNLELHTAGGFAFYNGTTGNGALGTNIATIASTGDIIGTRNITTGSGGVHSFGINSAGLNAYQGGAHMHYGAGTASFIGYNYNLGSYTDMALGNSNLFIKASNGCIGIGTTGPGFPLVVSNTVNGSFAGTYGYLNSGGSGTGSGTGTVAVSISCPNGRIFAVEVDCQSDERIKTDIRDIEDNEAIDFIQNINPINYALKKTGEKSYGYLAQQILRLKKHTYEDLIEIHPSPDPIDEVVDDDGFISPKDHIFSISYMKVIPILHKAIQLQQNEINDNKKIIYDLIYQLEQLQNEIKNLLR